MEVGRAEEEDAAAVAALWTAAYTDDPRGGRRTAYAIEDFHSTAEAGEAELSRLAVAEQQRRRGIGRSLVESCLRLATGRLRLPGDGDRSQESGTETWHGEALEPAGPKTLKITIKSKGMAKTKLADAGKAKVKAKIVFTPSNGAPVTKTKAITLKKTLAG